MNVNRRELFYTVSMLLIIALVVFVLNLMILSSAWSVALFRGHAKVKSVSVSQTGKPRYLTSVQKNELLELLNESEHLQTEIIPSVILSLPKVSLHCFDKRSIDLIPLGTIDEKLVVAILEGKERSFIIEKEPGCIQNALLKAFED